MDQEQVSFEIDPRSITAALAQMNSAVQGFEKGAIGSNERLNAAYQRVSDLLVKTNDRSRGSMENLTKSIERQAAAYGKTGIDKLISQRDAYIKRLGDEEGMIKRVTASYDKMIAAEGGGNGNKFSSFGEGVKNFMENPLRSAQGVVTGLLEDLGPMGRALAAVAGGLGGIAAAGLEAAKSLGEYGVRIRDVELRTGLSGKEAQQFAFAARAVGQDVSVTERLMRGLTMAIEDDSSAGAKAREALKGFGVDIRAVKDGSVPTSQVLQQISAGLDRMPNQWDRNKAALDLFKKAGIETIPFILELNKNLKESEGINFASDEDLKRYGRYQTEVAKIGTEWDLLALKLKEPIAGTVLAVVNFVDNQGKPVPALNGVQTAVHGTPKSPDIPNLVKRALYGMNDADISFEKQRIGADQAAFGRTDEGLKVLAEKAEKDAGSARDTYFSLQNDKSAGLTEIKSARDAWREAEHALAGYRGELKAMTKAQSEATSNAEALAKLQKDAAIRSTLISPMQAKLAEFTERPGVTPGQMQQAREAMAPLLLKERQDALDKFRANGAEMIKKTIDELGKSDLTKDTEEFTKGLARSQRERQDSIRVLSGGLADDTALRQAREEGAIRLQGIGDVAPGAQLRTEEQLLASRMRFADEAYQHELGLAEAQHKYDGQLDDAKTELRMKHAREVSGLEIELSEKVAEEQRRQFDEIKTTSEGLWRTLFTKPAEFGRQLAGTIRDALLKPVTEGLGNITANALKPIVYGANGDGGIAGGFKSLFASQQSPIKISTDLNTTAHYQNSAAIMALTGVLSAGLSLAAAAPAPSAVSPPNVGASISAVESSVGISPAPPVVPEGPVSGVASSPLAPSPVGAASSFGLAANPISEIQNLVGGPGGTPGFAGRVSPGGAPGGVLGSAVGFKSILSSLGIGNAGNLAGSLPMGVGGDTAAQAEAIPGLGSIAPLSSPGQFSKIAGSPLATSLGLGLGISGVQRGGLLGTIEGTAGGALAGFGIGAQIGALGGPLGMAIGAGIGLTASLISTFLFEPPWKEAQRLIKQLYRVDISRQMADNIVGIAKQKYAGQVSIAVRDPDVRKMIELYAAGTNQQMPLSASTPRAGSLVESGGKLYQAPAYQFGHPYLNPSYLPVMGAKAPAQWPVPSTPTPAAAQTVVLNVNGQSAADLLEGRVAGVVSPGFVQDQWAAASSSSNGRTRNSAMIQQPGLILS